MSLSSATLHSFEHLFLAWALSTIAAGGLALHALRVVRWRHIRRLHFDERGSYTLSFVFILPIYVITMLFVLETTLLLVTKIGTIYAAFAGARAAIVQYPSNAPQEAQSITEYAALKAFVPFANGVERHHEAENKSSDDRIEDYLKAYTEYASKPGSTRYLRAKYLYTKAHVTVKSNLRPAEGPSAWDADITVTVTCDYALHFPIFGRLLGYRNEGGRFYHPVPSTVTLQNEGPKNDEQKLGIGYASP